SPANPESRRVSSGLHLIPSMNRPRPMLPPSQLSGPKQLNDHDPCRCTPLPRSVPHHTRLASARSCHAPSTRLTLYMAQRRPVRSSMLSLTLVSPSPLAFASTPPRCL